MRPTRRITAEQTGDGLRFGPMLGVQSPSMSTNELNRLGCMTVRYNAHVPPIEEPDDAPMGGVGADPNGETMNGTTSFGQMIGGVATFSVDAFGVIVERPARVDEHHDRGVAAVRGSEGVDSAHRTCRRAPSQRAWLITPPIIITVGSCGGG